MKLTLAAGIATILAGTALGQWSANPNAPLMVGDRSGEQNQVKIGPTADGGCYIGWFDNNAGGYDVYLQRLDIAGHEMWAHNGILVADRAVSSTQDWDLIVDGDGNALCAFNDTTSQIRVHKVSPAGVLLWGAGALPPSGASQGPPQLAVLSDGNIMVAWSQSNTMMYQKLTGGGALTGSLFSFAEAGHAMLMDDICAADNGSFIAVWNRAVTTNYQTSSKHIYCQKYDANFNAVWPVTSGLVAKAVFNANGLSSGYFPPISADGAGGFVIGYYEGGGSRLAYIQHVLSDGSSKFAGSGLASPIPAGRIAVGGSGSFDAATGEYFLAWPEVISGTQNQYSVSVQKWDTGGAAQWGAAGVSIIATNLGADYQNSFVQTVADKHGGCFVFGFQAQGTAGGVPLWTWGAQATGGARRWFKYMCTITNQKGRLCPTLTLRGIPMIAYAVGASVSAYDVAAQAIQQDGTIGPCRPDIGSQGGIAGFDMLLDNNDFIVFINFFFQNDARADLGSQGGVPGPDTFFDNNDFVVFIGDFFSACL